MSTGYGPIPNQRMRHQARVKISCGDYVVLPPQAIIKVVRQSYLAKDHPFYDADLRFQAIAFTQFGMALVDRSDIDWEVY